MTNEMRELVTQLPYVAAILEANANKFAVPDHISAKVKCILQAADTIKSLSDRIAVLEARQHGGENGAAGDAIDYALGYIANEKAKVGFLDDWRDGRDLDTRWPGYVRWLAVQRAGAAEARASLTPQEEHRS